MKLFFQIKNIPFHIYMEKNKVSCIELDLELL